MGSTVSLKTHFPLAKFSIACFHGDASLKEIFYPDREDSYILYLTC